MATTFGGGTADFSTHRITGGQYLDWLRSWYDGRPIAAGLPVISLEGECAADETVPQGYLSPYAFARQLRQLAGDEDAAVLAVPATPPGKRLAETVYFCWVPANRPTGQPRRDDAANRDVVGALAIYHVR